MSNPFPQKFDPMQQIEQGFEALDIAFVEARTVIGRLEWAKDKLVAEIAALRDERDRLEIYDEREAAFILHITPGQLGDLRRSHKFAHIGFGAKIRYTRQHLNAIIDYFEIKQRTAMRKAA